MDETETGSEHNCDEEKPHFLNQPEITAELELDIQALDKFSHAFLDEVIHGLEHSKAQLSELTSNQTVLIETLQQENSKFDECDAFRDLSTTIAKAKQYHAKLLNIKKEMCSMHDKSYKLKKRAIKIQQLKQKEELQKANQRERDMERERALMAKPAQPLSPGGAAKSD